MASRRLLPFVVLTGIAAVAALYGMPRSGVDKSWPMLLALAGLAAVGSGQAVRIPALRTEVTAADAFIFAALAGLGPRDAALVGAAGVVGAALGGQRRPLGLHLAFNLADIVLSTTAGWTVFALVGGEPGAALADVMVPLAAATAAYFVTNTFLVAIAIVIDRREPLVSTWRKSGLWTAVASFTGLTLAVFLLLLMQTIGPVGLALGIPPCWLVTAFYRGHKARIEQQEQRIETIEERNTELERKVTERTRDLQGAMATLARTNYRLQQSNDRLSAANRAKTEFLARVSHELRTPLNAIIGFSDLLADPAFGDRADKRAEFLADIKSSGEHLLDLIDSLLDLSKIEAGRMEVKRELTRLPTVLTEVAAMLHPQARKKRLRINVCCDPDVVVGLLDQGMFREVLTNLISNAVKFTEVGQVTVEASADGATLVVAVRDTGIGVAASDQAKLFTEFYQVDGSYTRKYQGTGLGLALVKRLVELHGGTVALQSSPGEGSCFTCRFPDCLRPAPETPTPQATFTRPVPRPSQRRVLVVEDNPLNAKLVRNLLRARGYLVLEAASAARAEELLRGSPDEAPDLILMDVELPDIDGLELTRRLKADASTAAIPVLAVSAHAHAHDEERARAAGCSGYIRKPIRLHELPATIEAHCRAEEPAAALTPLELSTDSRTL